MVKKGNPSLIARCARFALVALVGCGSVSSALDGSTGDAAITSDAAMMGDGGASTALPIDCRTASARSMPSCQRPTPSNSTRVGSGPRPAAGDGFPRVQNGFVDAANGRLIVAVRSGTDAGMHGGAIMAVDLSNGNRTLISGTFLTRTASAMTAGSGPSGQYYVDVQPAGASWYVWTRGPGEPSRVLSINPSDGARTLVWDTAATPCRVAGSGSSMVTLSLDTDIDSQMTVAPDGAIYVNIADAGLGGIARFKDGACTVVSAQGSNTAAVRGAGPTWSMASVQGVRFFEGALFTLDFQKKSLFRVDPNTGDRTVVSSSDSSMLVGAGDGDVGTSFLQLIGAIALTSGGGRGRITEIDLASGNRTNVLARATPPLTALDETIAWQHPSQAGQLIVASESALFVLEKSTGNVNYLSY